MWKIVPYSIVQSILLTGGQVFLKFALAKMPAFSWTKDFWCSLLINWQYILKYFPFSLAYPMVSLSYVFGMFAAIIFFHESVSLTKWLGVLFIIVGCSLIVK